MIRVLSAAFIALPLTAAMAQQVPTLNIEPSCQAAANGSLGLKQDLQACRSSENNAREEVSKQWAEFTPADRAGCLSLTTMSGSPGTYTELLTCLEMKRAVSQLPKEPPLGTVGRATR
ncbi:MAG: hypothetical protein QOC56_2865 [Alphaproteobacteria bacterium]|jgi:hypothetical protein|nr:hypothetical protein [Alphaproteobacteria bacterium]MEA2939361.1 hypothetical protein [Alphaproteobacteria bacterium]